jgi:hypothetical protein
MIHNLSPDEGSSFKCRKCGRHRAAFESAGSTELTIRISWLMENMLSTKVWKAAYTNSLVITVPVKVCRSQVNQHVKVLTSVSDSVSISDTEAVVSDVSATTSTVCPHRGPVALRDVLYDDDCDCWFSVRVSCLVAILVLCHSEAPELAILKATSWTKQTTMRPSIAPATRMARRHHRRP